MKLITTPKELDEYEIWGKYCQVTGTNLYAVAEGLMTSDQEITIDETTMKALSLAVMVQKEQEEY